MPYKCGSCKCDLYFSEKVAIAPFEEVGLLNKQTELLSNCSYRNKFVIGYIKWKINFCCDGNNNCFIGRISVEFCHC